MVKMRRVVMRGTFALLAALSVGVAQGADYYLKSGATDLSLPSSYTIGSADGADATTTPGGNDEVIVPSGTFSFNANSASFTTLSGVKRVRPQEGAVLEITVNEGDSCVFNAPVNDNGTVGAVANDAPTLNYWGRIVKKGNGSLTLASFGKTKNGSYNQDYLATIEIAEGALKLPQTASTYMNFGNVVIADGATLFTCRNGTNGVGTYLHSLSGYGIVTNETTSAVGAPFGLHKRQSVANSEFHGRICAPVYIQNYGHLTQFGHDTGINSRVRVSRNEGHLNDGFGMGVYSFEDVALLGPEAYVDLNDDGGGIHYFGGADATVSKTIRLYTYTYPAFLDAGSHGGLTFSGYDGISVNMMGSNSQSVQKWLVLTGSNTVPCNITGKFKESNFGGTFATYRTIFTQKLGSGTWRMSGNRGHGGGFAIEEGTLQFDTIAERGVDCSLGFSTNLSAACSVSDPVPVPYAFTLGSTNEAVPTAAFEFVGEKSSICSTRPLVLAGAGGSLRASGASGAEDERGARLGFSGVSARDAGETTLVLDGDNVKFNTAANITDGDGTVSVVKDGAGEWYLSGTNSFSGDLRVKAGTLTVLGPKYTWFRFTVKQLGLRDNNRMQVRELALYDRQGVRQNICLKVDTNEVENAKISGQTHFPDSDWAGLLPGSFAFGSATLKCSYGTNANVNRGVDQFFDDVGNAVSAGVTRFDGTTSYGNIFEMYVYSTANAKMYIHDDNPNSWIPFVMRLTNGAPEIVAYDIQGMGTGNQDYMPNKGTMEASVDGIFWDLVETNETGEAVAVHDYDIKGRNIGNTWYSDNSSSVNWNPATGTTPRPGKGFPMRPRADLPMPLQNVRSVAVDAGATLRTETETVISSLKVDSQGAGTLEGFTFAASGTLDVVHDGKVRNVVDLPGTYVSCSGFENLAKWTLKINGEPTSKVHAEVVDGKVRIYPDGMMLTVR